MQGACLPFADVSEDLSGFVGRKADFCCPYDEAESQTAKQDEGVSRKVKGVGHVFRRDPEAMQPGLELHQQRQLQQPYPKLIPDTDAIFRQLFLNIDFRN